jgi:magnesium transporter
MLREGVGFLVYTVMDAIIDGYSPLMNAIEEELEGAEMEIFTRFHQERVQRLLELKRTLFTLRRVLYPLRETFSLFLRRDQPLFSANTLVYFRDVYDHILRILDVLDVERDMVASTLDAHLTVVSNQLNQTMKTLTVITVIVALAGSVFGAWGMNFEAIPLATAPWGFWGVMGSTITLIVIALIVSRWRGWL